MYAARTPDKEETGRSNGKDKKCGNWKVGKKNRENDSPASQRSTSECELPEKWLLGLAAYSSGRVVRRNKSLTRQLRSRSTEIKKPKKGRAKSRASGVQ